MKPVPRLILVVVAVFVAAGCQPQAQTKASLPAAVITENDPASIVLQPDAERRLGIEIAPVTIQKVGRTRLVGGELLLPLGRVAERSGDTTSSNQSIYSLLPAMTPTELVRVAEMQVDANGRIAAAQVQVDTTRLFLERAERLVVSQAGTQRALDEARAQFQLAEAALQTARERRALFGAPIFDAVRKDVLWVRVPIYAGDLEQINRSAPARVSSLGRRNDAARAARPVDIPFSGATASAAIDLHYELSNADGAWRPGQKVTAALPLEGETDGIVVPAAAVLYDIQGGAWVYERTGPQTFTRRRVEVRHASDAGIVLARGVRPGAGGVTAGAAELFGTEFGVGK